MLKQLLLSTTLVVAISTPVLASLLDKKYFKLDAGASFASPSKFINGDQENDTTKFGNSMVFGVGIGTEIADGFRAEVNITKRNIKSEHIGMLPGADADPITTVSYKPLTYMANIYYDFKLNDIFTPYAGVGLGITQFKPSIKNGAMKATFKELRSTSWQLGLGTGIKATENITFDVGYKYTHLGNVNPKETTHKAKLASHELMAGLRIGF